MSNLTADQVAGLFAQRLPETGGWISAKQIEWLLRTFAAENRIPRGRTASGVLADGREWVATQSGNANRAGTLQLVSVAARDADRAAEAERLRYEAACLAVNNEVSALLLAGKVDEVRARLERFAADEAARKAPAAPAYRVYEDGSDDYCGEDDLTARAIENSNDYWASMQTALDEGER